MKLIGILLLLSAVTSGLIFYFGGYYANIVWIWLVPVLIIAFFMAYSLLYAVIVFSIGLRYQRLPKRYGPSPFAMWVLSQSCTLCLLFARCNVHARGLGKLDMKRRYMIVSNHLSAFDHVGFCSLFHDMDVIAVSKRANEEMYGIGGWIKRAGYLPIDQTDLIGGAEVISRAGELLKDNITSVMICPEGTRNRDFPNPIMLPCHPGSFAMAYQSKCPIALFAVQNTNAVASRFPLHMTHLYYDCVAVLEYEEYKDLTPNELSLKCHELIQSRLEKKAARFYHLEKKEEKQD